MILQQVVDGLLQAAGSLGVTVVDGEPLENPPGDYVCVGWAPDQPSISSTVEWSGLGQQATAETYTIPVYINVFSGGVDLPGVRGRAITLADSLLQQLRADPTLGGVLTTGWVQPGELQVHQARTPDGVAAGVTILTQVVTRP